MFFYDAYTDYVNVNAVTAKINYENKGLYFQTYWNVTAF